MSLVFHGAMVLADAAVLFFLARRPGLSRLFPGVLLAVFLGALLASLLGRGVAGSFFLFLRFMAQGIAFHGPLLLGISAVLLRRASPRLAVLTGAAALGLTAVGLQAFVIEPRWLEVSRYTIMSAKLEEPLRIVVLADYQTDRLGAYERRIWKTAQEENGDLILLPGDYLQVGDVEKRKRLRELTRDYLREIAFGEGARLGAFAVAGDVEYRDADWADLFAGLRLMAFDETQTIELRGLTLTALSPRDSRNPELTISPSPRFHVIFGHAPDYALLDLTADLQIAGHTHGGQLRVPGLGPLLTFSRVPRSWAAGLTDLGDGRVLVVSRGLGMERGHAPRLRFFCRPEIVVLDLLPKRESESSERSSKRADRGT